MYENTEFTLNRDCEAIQIPSGQKTTIPAGTQGVITQSLGGSYTIATYQGLGASGGERSGRARVGKAAAAANAKICTYQMAKFQRKMSGTSSGNVTIPRSPLTLLISVWSTIAG